MKDFIIRWIFMLLWAFVAFLLLALVPHFIESQRFLENYYWHFVLTSLMLLLIRLFAWYFRNGRKVWMYILDYVFDFVFVLAFTCLEFLCFRDTLVLNEFVYASLLLLVILYFLWKRMLYGRLNIYIPYGYYLINLLLILWIYSSLVVLSQN